jgi:putative addiction module component (TIGR02574 family)
MDELAISEPEGFWDLPKADQIRYLQRLWDRIAETPEEVPVLESHLRLAQERLEAYRRDPSGGRSAYEHLDEIEGRR